MKLLDFNMCVSYKSFLEKPGSEEYAGLRNTFNNIHYNNIEEFKNDLSNGRPFIACKFTGDLKENGAIYTDTEHCMNSTAIVMDFENGDWTEAKLMTYCKKYDIMPNIFYHSFSSTTRKERFRCIWVCQIDVKLFKSLSSLVKLSFDVKSKGGIDAASLNIVQQYHATNKEIKILSDEYVDFENFIKCIYDVINDDKKAKKLILKETKIDKIVVDRIEYESKIGNYYNKYIKDTGRVGFMSYKVVGEITKNDKELEKKDYNNTDSDLLIKRCRLINELMTAKQDYYNYSLSTGLVYSLVYSRNGKDIYKQICDNNATSSWKKKEKIFDDIKKKDYMPMACSKIGCPYYGSCVNSGYSPADLCKPTFKSLKQETETIDVDEARITMNKKLDEAFNSSNDKVYIIESPVGSGKTYSTIDLINEEFEKIVHNKSINSEIRYVESKRFMRKEDKEKRINELKEKLLDIKKFIVASPRHNLCSQIYKDLLDKSNINKSDVVYMVQRPVIPYIKIEEEVEELERLGLLKLKTFKEHYRMIKKIKDIIHKNYMVNCKENNLIKAFELYPDETEMLKYNYSNNDYSDLLDFIRKAEEYINSREESQNANILICTHAFLSNIDLNSYNQDVVFIDEDCSESFIQTNRIKIKTIEKMINVLENNEYEYRKNIYYHDDIINNLKFIISQDENKIITYNFYDFLKSPTGKKKFVSGLTNKRLEHLIDLKRDNKIDFTTILNLKSFYIQGEWLNYTTFKSLKHNNKNIILTSATPAPDFFYKNIFNREIVKENIPFVKLKGELIQYIDMYCFRKNLKDEDYKERLNKIKEVEKIDNIISYKSFNDELSNILNFGNLEGINEYEGQNIIVAGTYIVNPMACQLIAHMFDIPGNEGYLINEVELLKNRKIVYNNIEQNFTTFQNENAREYQLWQCWKTMEQAVGRARLINNDCKVVLLSKMIHPLAKLTTYNEEVKEENK